MRFALLFWLVVFLFKCSYAQKDFRRGFIVTQKNDTVRGWVSYLSGLKAHQQCVFKDSKTAEPKVFSPADLAGYGFDGDSRYTSMLVKTGEDDPKLVFLEVLVSGKVSLYEYDRLFLVRKDGELIYALTNDLVKINTPDGGSAYKKSNQYIGILSLIMADCKSIGAEIGSVRISERMLTDLVVNYNRCVGVESKVYRTTKQLFKVNFGVCLGGGASFIKIKSDDPWVAPMVGTYDPGYLPIPGIFLDVSVPRISQRTFLHVGLEYMSMTYSHYKVIDVGEIRRNWVDIHIRQVRIPVGFLHTITGKVYKPYFGLGLSPAIFFNREATLHQEIESSKGDITTSDSKRPLRLKDYQLGAWCKVGMVKHVSSKLDAFAELRYELTNGILNNSYGVIFGIRSSVSNLEAGVGLRFH